MAATHDPAPQRRGSLTPIQALIVVPLTMPLVLAFIALSVAVGAGEFYIGFFFLLYWLGFKHGSFSELPAAAIGGFVGLGLAVVMQQLQAHLGAEVGGLAFGAVMLVTIFLLLTALVPLAVNDGTMVFFTAASIPHVLAHASLPGMFLNLALGIVYFGALMAGVQALKARADARAAVKAAAPAE